MEALVYAPDMFDGMGVSWAFRDWMSRNMAIGAPLTGEFLRTSPDPLFVWELALQLDTGKELVWVAVNIAFGNAAKVVPSLSRWVGLVTRDNWEQARSSALSAAAMAKTDREREAALAATDWMAWPAVVRSARATEETAAKATVAGIRARVALREAAIEWLTQHGAIVG